MRTPVLLSVLSCLALHVAAAEPRIVTVTCSLPDDRQIWPLPPTTASTVVEAEFISIDELLRIRAGNYFQITSRAVYHVSGSHPEFPHDEISFILRERWPTPESGIMLKALMSPFGPATKARFWMSKRPNDVIWDIQTYEIWGEHFHRKPGS